MIWYHLPPILLNLWEAMPQILRSALVGYSAEQMFELVNDVPAYGEFLPGCARGEIHERTGDEIKASVHFEKGIIRNAFTTHNRLARPYRIEMKLLDGPFRLLEGVWRFDALTEEACKVSLSLDFEFSSRMVEVTIGGVFNQMAGNMVNAFVGRAREIYGV